MLGRYAAKANVMKWMVVRAHEAWTAAELEFIGFHECRHTFVTSLIHSGLNMKAVSILAGHASIAITADRYGHLFPGSEEEAGRLLAAFYAVGDGSNVVPLRKAS
jgi:integrase